MENKLSNILQLFPNITFALLFGSYSNGTQKYLSDIDIAIFTDEKIDIFTQGEMIATLESELGKKVDLVVLNVLYKSNSKLSFNITNNHKLLFCNDQDKYIEFKTDSLKYYFDMSYTFEMFDNELKKRIDNGTYGKVKAS